MNEACRTAGRRRNSRASPGLRRHVVVIDRAVQLGGRNGCASPALRRLLGTALLGLGLLHLAAVPPGAWAQTLHRERSLYQTVLVTKRAHLLCLKFSQRRNHRLQSCRDERRPQQLALTYTKMMLSALLLNPAPSRILIVGLGGGSLPMALAALYPQAGIEVVEIDPAVVKVAQSYFGFRESDRLKLHVQDARVFTRRASGEGPAYDLIMLDAFGADYIPEHLMTQEFLQEAKALLREDGVLAANTFATSRLYNHESTTYREVFGPFLHLRLAENGNRIILAGRNPLPSLLTLRSRAAELAGALAPYGVNIEDYPARLTMKVDWDPEARVLTDQYAPANLLQER